MKEFTGDSNLPLEQSIDDKNNGKFTSLVKKVVKVNLATFAISVANEIFLQHTAVGFSQVAMEGVDSVLPVALDKANNADNIRASKKAIGWRSATNLAHIAAGSAGIYEATNFLNQDMDYDAKSIAVSGLIGLWNLGLLNSIRHHRRNKAAGGHEVVVLSPDSIAQPESVQDVLDESHHTHPNISGRNLENLEMCAKSNIVEALPPLLGPFVQMGWENGSAGMVIASNAAVVAMAGWQQIKDLRILRGLSDYPA